MANQHPWMPWYVVDWLQDRDVKKMHRVARSMYFDLLNHEWLNGPFPDDVNEVASILGEDRRSVAAHWPSIRRRFVIDSTSTCSHLKLESLRTEARIKSEKASKAAKEKWTRHANAYATATTTAIPSESESESESHKISEGPAVSKLTAPPRKPKKAAQPKSERPRWSEVVAVYSDEWKALHSLDGRGPEMDGADVSALARLYDERGPDETITLLKRFVSDTDPLMGRRGFLLRDLPSRLNAYRAKQVELSIRGALPKSTSVSDETRAARKF